MRCSLKSVGSWLLAMTALLFLTACAAGADTQTSQTQNVGTEASTVSLEETSGGATNPLDGLTITLPDGMTRQRESDTRESFVTDAGTVGGVFLLPCDNAIFDDVLHYYDVLSPLMAQAMEDLGLPEMEWNMLESSVYGLDEYNCGNDQSEYIAYILRGDSACYVAWFDRSEVAYEVETAIMDSLHSDDITEELNKISTEAYMDAISQEMEGGDYRFEVTLPSGMTQEATGADSALFYQGEQLVGGFQVVHFEKGILPAVAENGDRILEQLKESVKDQIDLSDYEGEIVDERLITAAFTRGEQTYTHYILSYGQVGTQYDLWLDTTALDTSTVDSILWGAQLVAY